MLDCSRNQDLKQRRKGAKAQRKIFRNSFTAKGSIRGPVKTVSVSPLLYVLFDLTMEIATPAIGQSFNLYSAP